MKITIETYLRTLAENVFSEPSKKLRRTLNCKMNPMQCLVLHCAAIGKSPNGHYYQSARNRLLAKKYLYTEQSDIRTINHKLQLNYKLTTLGVVTHAEIVEKIKPRVEAINNKLKEKQAV